MPTVLLILQFTEVTVAVSVTLLLLCYYCCYITVATDNLCRGSLLSGAAELTIHLLSLINILWLPLCRINKFGVYFPRKLLRSPILMGHQVVVTQVAEDALHSHRQEVAARLVDHTLKLCCHALEALEKLIEEREIGGDIEITSHRHAGAGDRQALRHPMSTLHKLTKHVVPLHPKKLRGLLALMPRLSLRRHRAHLLAQILHVGGETVQVSLDLGAVCYRTVASCLVAAVGGAERGVHVLELLDAAAILP